MQEPAQRQGPPAPAPPRPAARVLAALGLVLAAVLSLLYAGWAVIGRLGIFAALAAGRTVSIPEARANDRMDTLLAAIAGIAVLLVLAGWVVREIRGQASGGLFDALGMALTGTGLVVAVVGLYLVRRVVDGTDVVAAGRSGVTASLVTAMGSGLAALGCILGLLALRGRARRDIPPTAPNPDARAQSQAVEQ